MAFHAHSLKIYLWLSLALTGRGEKMDAHQGKILEIGENSQNRAQRVETKKEIKQAMLHIFINEP